MSSRCLGFWVQPDSYSFLSVLDRSKLRVRTSAIISLVVALVIEGTEAIGLLKDQLKLTGYLWVYVDNVNQ
jgi:high-affinity nickel permease